MLKPLSLFILNLSKPNITAQVKFASSVLPQFSSEKYGVKRKSYGVIQSKDVEHFKSILGEDRVLTDESDVLPFNIDWIKNCRGQSKVVLKPKTTEEVSEILSYCNSRRLAVCPQGGNTGLVGGSVPVFDEIVLSFNLMNKIISLDEISGALVCESGCVLETLDNYVRERSLIMPLDLGAKGSCHIGGNVSTNAGGLRLLRYGNLHGSILGLEAVGLLDGGVFIATLFGLGLAMITLAWEVFYYKRKEKNRVQTIDATIEKTEAFVEKKKEKPLKKFKMEGVAKLRKRNKKSGNTVKNVTIGDQFKPADTGVSYISVYPRDGFRP